MYVDEHYSGISDPGGFQSSMRALATKGRQWAQDQGAQGFIGTGASGIIALGAMQMVNPDIPYMWVRKPGESSHGSTISGNKAACSMLRDVYYARQEPFGLIAVDDFIASGETIGRIANTLVRMGAPLRLRGVIGYHASRMPQVTNASIPPSTIQWAPDDYTSIPGTKLPYMTL